MKVEVIKGVKHSVELNFGEISVCINTYEAQNLIAQLRAVVPVPEDIQEAAFLAYPVKEKLNYKGTGKYDKNFQRRRSFAAGMLAERERMMKEQSHPQWKPSEVQLDALWAALGVTDYVAGAWIENGGERSLGMSKDELHEIIAQAMSDKRLADEDVLEQFEREAALSLTWAAEKQFRRDGKLKEQKPAEWSAEDEKNLVSALQYISCSRLADSSSNLTDWLKALPERIKSLRPQSNNNLRWRRATAGANLPESIILPDGEEPRFGKCAVMDSYYIPISELKELPKE